MSKGPTPPPLDHGCEPREETVVVPPSEHKRGAITFFDAALVYYASLGITVDSRDAMTSARQQVLLRIVCVPQSLQVTGVAPCQDQSKRQGQALHSDILARVGLRAALLQTTSAKNRWKTLPVGDPNSDLGARIAVLAASTQLAQIPPLYLKITKPLANSICR